MKLQMLLTFVLFSISPFAQAALVNHPVTYTFINADGTPASNLEVMNQEVLTRMRCKLSISVCGGSCKAVEKASANERGVTDTQGKVTFSYDTESLLAKIESSDKLCNQHRTGHGYVRYWVSIVRIDGSQFECAYPVRGTQFSRAHTDYAPVLWLNGSTVTSDLSEVTCQLK